ncbi:Cubilin [Orchesella cincta]|uniref:Cubilin n=1 Tax=Orchesella cincta TaxID=48709 RepID=A0A1D2N1N1_ORCCI|nr:Cubilin [Orchesella cincta]
MHAMWFSCVLFVTTFSVICQQFSSVGAVDINYQLGQPQIYVENGHIYVIPAENRNLVLKSNGNGKIVLNNVELKTLVDSVQNSSKAVNDFKNIFGNPSAPPVSGQTANIEQTIQRLNQVESLDGRVTVIERRIASFNATDTGSGPRLNTRLNRLRTRVETVENRLGGRSGTQNPCHNNPCSNGGKCIPTIYGAFCMCLPGWEGEQCNQDVNECANNQGTEFGCQNGGTCLNTPGSWHCQCRTGFVGTLCSKRSGDCSSGSDSELCDHGRCIDRHSGPNPYTCLCDPGWKTDGRSAACNIDIDECSQYQTTCSVNPPVSCINTPGSFACGPCPPGYSGNGHQCMDINECYINNGGCSINPMVQCTNTQGSRTCGPCPPGYMGNGIYCQYVGICHMNNGGCHPLARCVENPAKVSSNVSVQPDTLGQEWDFMAAFHIRLPERVVGRRSKYTAGGNTCSPNPCQNGGICHSYGATFTCACTPGFLGPTCAMRASPCVSQPCQNGGTCQATATGFTCTCPTDYTGDFCERQAESCGGYLAGEEGTLKYPQTQSTYSHNAYCEWLMRTAAGKVFNITFTNFHLEGDSSCSFDYLDIRDGSDNSAPLIGKFCGEQLPLGGTVISTHNALHLTFKSDHNVFGLGFELSWNSTDPVCGGIENGTHGSISSPGYPGKYPHDRDCTWQIKVSLGKKIQLVFASFQLENHPNCSYDYLEIRDGLEETAPVLEKLCNTTVPAPVISSGPYLTIRFHSDDSSSDRGFLITYNEIPGIPGCGGLLTSATGVFSSPHHPQPYAHGLECDWLIRLPSRDDRISLKFLTFELEQSFYRGCFFDYVQVHDGPSQDSPLVGRFCGRNIPPDFKSRSNQLFIKFRSDESIALGGFSAKYEAVCGGEYFSSTGILRSPYYPSNYPRNRDCVYVISQPAGRGINIQFLDFDIEPGSDTSCYFDYLEIRDGDTKNSSLIGHYCGPPQASPEILTSSYNYLWLRFKTDGSVQNRGFLANYSTFDTGCGGILRNSNGTITSPGHPEVYPHGVRCMWVIRGVSGQVVRLTWDTFNLESSTTCRYDAIEIYDNSTHFPNGSLVGRFCGQDHPPVITSSDTTLTVFFRSDHSLAYDGFMASYKILNATTGKFDTDNATYTLCGGNYFTEYGVVKSPRYPNTYPNSKSCVWVITAPRGRQIELNVTDFDLEDATTSGCRYDYLEIRNGRFSTSPLIGKYCGNRPPPLRIPSFSNSLYLKFRSDTSHVRSGFHIIWDATSTGCGGMLTSPSGSISSPNYPSSYDVGLECLWKIQVNQGSLVQLSFVDIDIQQSGSQQCWGEHVEVLDGSDRNSPSLGKFCSEDHVISFQSTGNSVTVKFVSYYGSSGRGFQLNYRTLCNRVLKGFQGVIESPNYPNPYPHNRNCTWTIEASRGNKVNVSFSHFDIEAPYRGNCSYDFVEISEWKRYNSDNKTVLGTYCGTNRPRLVSSTSDTMSVTFVSDFSHASNGFRLEWKQYGCGGRIIGEFGFVKSPDYPKRYAHGVECIWRVTTELGTKVQLSIYDMDIERGHDCHWDGVEVYGGPDESSPLLNRFCETIQSTSDPTQVVSHGNNMYIKFYSDYSVAARGFYGSVRQVAGGCGGSFRASSGYIYSPNYPANYDHNDDCSWLITVDPNHVVKLQFEAFDIERHINCSYDHIGVYDGNSDSNPLLLMHCGNQLPDPVEIQSTGYQMLVRLKTDGSASGKGFKARYSYGCGARLTGRQAGVITTPSFPGILSGHVNCSWIIVGSSPDDRVTLTFTYMDLSMSSDSCSENYVEVLDGEDNEAPSVYKACNGPIPPAITSRGNALILRIVGSHYYGHGFRAVYDLSSSACGGVLTAANGSITSPSYPNGYPNNVECIWLIKAAPGNQVQLGFRRFEVASSDFCNSDFVEIHEDGAHGRLLGHFCGNEIPSNITAANQLWILFRTDSEGQAAGFWADFTLVHGVELSGPSGSIASPMFPHTYSGTGKFTWRVTVNETYSVQIRFFTFNFDSYDPDECSYSDKITIYDGYDENAPAILTACSRNVPDPVITSGNMAYIEFVKIGWFNSFFLRWQQVQGPSGIGSFAANITGCGGNFSLVHNNATSLTSPGFPFSYPPSLNCEWNFDAPHHSRIRIKPETFGLESSSSCMYDKVELYDGIRGLPNYELNKTICHIENMNISYLSSGRFLRVVFKTDRSIWNIGFNFTLTTECGGYVRESRGTITSPNYPNNYANSKCLWYIVVRPGRTIRVTFNSIFEIYSDGGECVTDQLILRNGANNESPFLGSGRYCGSTAPPILETSGNHLFVHFTSWTHGGKGFALTYEEVSLGCGGSVLLSDDTPSTIISSPNFPQIPPPYTECEWVFTAPQGEAVQVTFMMSFQLTISPGCQRAGVEVRDGGTAIASELGIFCRDMPGTLTSTGNVLYLKYYTDVSEPRNGFKAEVKIATCGGIHVGWAGTISSPGFPAAYDVNMDCTWTIRAQRGTYLILEFQNFNLGSSDTNCTRDKIFISESSADVLTPRNWTFCGNSDTVLPNSLQSGSNEIQIRFTTDNQRETATGLGFKLRYRTRGQQCGGNLRTPTGILQSPGYPQAYPNYIYCVWRIYAPAGRRIRFEFLDFDVEERIHFDQERNRCVDQVWIYQGVMRAVGRPLYNQSLCGSNMPNPVETSSNEATVYFRTDGSVAHRGFKLNYTTDLAAICGGVLELGEGNVTSPNDTTNTPNTTTNLLCDWKTIPGQSHGNGTTIVTVHSMKVPSWGVRDPLCSFGFLKVSPANSYLRYKWRSLCGTLNNEKLYLPGTSLHVEYVAQDLNSSFSLSYRNVPCGGMVSGPEANITSLNYPSAYSVNTECIWMVDFPRGTQIKIKFYDLDLDEHEGSEGCDRDYVIVRNGKYPSSPTLGKFCGTSLPGDMISMSNDLWIEFHSDGNADGSRRGFEIGLETISQGCGGVVHRKYGQIASPQAETSSRRYADNSECEWIIESIPGYTVNVVFFGRFDIEMSTNFDWVSLGRFCGRQLPTSINTTSTSVKILFRTNANINGDGFRLFWYSPCGGVFKGTEGEIRSAHFDSYNHSSHVNPGRFWSWVGWEHIYRVHKCDYVIEGDSNDYVMLQFLEPFEIQVPINYAVSSSELDVYCPRVNVSMWQGNATDVQLMGGMYCGTQLPPPFIARGSVTLSYSYQPIYQNYGFRVQFSRSECGGQITTPRTITSPGHPFTSAANMNCTWVVTSPNDRVVRFKFKFLEMEFHTSCGYDSVRLYDGPLIDDAKLIGIYCGNLTDDFPTIYSKSSSLTVLFQTDFVIQHGGFEGAIDFTAGEGQGCGGTKNVTAQPLTLQSIDLDSNGRYDDNLECQWLIIAPEFSSIEVTFNTFNIEGSGGPNKNTSITLTPGSCPYDYLEIRDGPGPYGLLLSKVCGSVIPSPVISSQNFIWIRFKTDASISFAGFTISVRSRPSPCGQLVFNATNEIQYIQSPGYPRNYDNNVRCRWRIDGARFYDEVDISFLDLDIEPAPDCNKDRLEIRDVTSSYTTPEGITGPTLFTGSGPRDWRFQRLDLNMSSILQDVNYCGSDTPSDFFTIGRSAEIVFHSDSITTRKGFKIGYKAAGCNRTHDSPQGRIFSPEWPTHTPIFSNCMSTIRAANGTFISLYFNFFKLQIPSGVTSCTETAFEIRDGSPTGTVLGQYCGSTIPDPVFSNSNILYLKFFSRMHPTNGYDLTYTTTDAGRGCGGNIFHTGGSFTSPLYPGNYSLNMDCRWRIRVPGGLRVQVEFTNFAINGDCSSDFLEISSMNSHDPSGASVLFSRYCAGDQPAVYSGTTDMAIIRYKTSTNNTGAGWRAVFKGVTPTNVPLNSQAQGAK